MTNLITEIIGWFGMFLILLAYFLLIKTKMSENSKSYHIMNLIGGISIAINALSNNAYPPAALNIVWSIIAIYSIIKGLKIFK